MRRKEPVKTFPCPHCGAEVSAKARSCRACGSDARTGWREADDIGAASVEIPEPELSTADYDDFLAREGLGGRRKGRGGRWWIAAILAILAAAALLVM